MSTDTRPGTRPGTRPAVGPGLVVDLRDRRPLPVLSAGRRSRLLRRQVLEVQRAALLHARVLGRRRG